MTILLAQFGVVAAGGVKYDLSDLAAADIDDRGTAAVTYSVDIIFRTTSAGDVDINKGQAANIPNVEQYIDPADGQALWVRCTGMNASGATPGGDTQNTWLSLTTQRNFSLSYASPGGLGFGVNYNPRFELATDSGGSNIVADTLFLGMVGTLGDPP